MTTHLDTLTTQDYINIIKAIFTVSVRFKDVPQDIEFLRKSGEVWRKLSPDEADKVNAPGAGSIAKMSAGELVHISPLDYRSD